MSGTPVGQGIASLVKLAWRSLGRQRRRTLLLVLVVAYATAAIVFFWAFTDGFLTSIFQGHARLVQAPALITTSAYHADPDPVHALADLDGPLAAAEASGTATAAAPRLDVQGLLRSPYASTGAQLRGIVPDLEVRVSQLHQEVRDGRLLEAPGEVVLGAGLAERLDVRVGERLAVDVASLAGPRALGLVVVGLVDAGIAAVDDAVVLVHLDDARSLSGVDTATAVAVAAPPGREGRAAGEMNALLGDGVRAYGVQELMGELAEGLATERLSMIPMGLLFSIFAAVAVTSSVVVSVMERTREFGVMIALGLDQARLSWMVTLEAVLATLVGYAVGALLGYGLIMWMSFVNVLGPLFGGLYGDMLAGLAVGDDIRTDVRVEYLLYAGSTVAFAALFAALTPARRVRRLVAAEAMRANA